MRSTKKMLIMKLLKSSFNEFFKLKFSGKKIYKTEQCATGQVYIKEVYYPEGNFELTTIPGVIESVGKYSLYKNI